MPRIRRENIPPALMDHLTERVRTRRVSIEQLRFFLEWLETQPEVPSQKWFKRFSGMTVCGEGELVKTFLVSGQVADGQEIF